MVSIVSEWFIGACYSKHLCYSIHVITSLFRIPLPPGSILNSQSSLIKSLHHWIAYFTPLQWRIDTYTCFSIFHSQTHMHSSWEIQRLPTAGVQFSHNDWNKQQRGADRQGMEDEKLFHSLKSHGSECLSQSVLTPHKTHPGRKKERHRQSWKERSLSLSSYFPCCWKGDTQ